MSAVKVTLVVVGLGLVVGWLTREAALFVPLSLFVSVLAFRNARDWESSARTPRDPSSLARQFRADTESIDLGDELADLLRSASYRAGRMLEDAGQLFPFVMYEDSSGTVKIRSVSRSDPELTLARAREAARAIDGNAPRLIVVVPGTAEFGRRKHHVVIYEAAERRFHQRTLAFVQRYDPRLVIFPARIRGLPIYIGDAPHVLRFVAPPAPQLAPSTNA